MEQPAEAKLKLFISYSRSDTATADLIVTALEEHGFEVFIDRRDIIGGEEWLNELRLAIAASDTVVWLVSHSSIVSSACLWELGEMQRQSKRLMPVALEPAGKIALPEAIGKIQLLPAVGAFSLEQNLKQLVIALNTDRGWLRTHTRLLETAMQWQENERARAFLLVGSALRDAEGWRDSQPRGTPPPNSSVLDLILASRRRSVARQRTWVAGAFAVAALGLGLAALAYVQRQIAVENESVAIAARALAVENERKALAAGEAERTARQLAEENERRAVGAQQAERQARQSAEANERRAVTAQEAEAAARAAEVEQRDLAEANARRAGENAELARRNEERAVASLKEAQKNLSLFRVQQAQGMIEQNDPTSAALLMLESLPDRTSPSETRRQWPLVPEAQALLDFTAQANIAERHLIGHRSRVHRLEFDGTGRRLVTAGLDGAWLWDIATGKAVTKLEGGSAGQGAIVWRGAFHPDGKSLVTANHDGKIRYWAAGTGRKDGEFDAGGFDSVRQLAFNPSGDKLALGGGGGVVLRDIAGGRTIGRTDAPAGDFGAFVSALEFNRDGTLLVASGSGRDVRLIDGKTGQQLKTLTGHRDAVHSATFSPQGDLLATGSQDGTVKIWRLDTMSILRTLAVAAKDVLHIAFSPIDRRLLVVSPIDQVSIWNVETGQRVRQIFHNSATHASWSPDGRLLVSVSAGGEVALWDAESGERKATFGGAQSRIHVGVFSPDGQLVATAAENGMVTLWPVNKTQSQASGGEAPADAQRARDCRTVVWMRNEAPLGRPSSIGEDNNDRIETPAEFAAVMRQISTLVPSVSRQFERSSGQLRHENISFDRERRRAVSIAMNPRGPDWTQMVLVWDVPNGKIIRELEGHVGRIHGAVLSPDGRFALSYGDDKIARIWDLETRDPPRRLEGHTSMIWAGCFSADGSKVATGSTDNTIRLWDATTGRLLQTRTSRLSGVWHLDFSEDQKWLVAAAHSTAKSINDPPNVPVEAHRIVTDPQDLVDAAKSRIGRCFAARERQQLLLEREPPHWCIEARKAPYDAPAWQIWLQAKQRGENTAMPITD